MSIAAKNITGGYVATDVEVGERHVEVNLATDRAVTPLGTYVPAAWGWGGGPVDGNSGWKSKRASRSLTQIRFLGDSTTNYYASSLSMDDGTGTSSAARLAQILQSRYGDGGSGIALSNMSTLIQTSYGIGSTAKTYYAGLPNAMWATTGTWTTYSGAGALAGNGYTCLSSIVAGSTASKQVRGSTVKIFDIGSLGGYSYSIDNGALTGTVAAGGSFNMRTQTLTPPATPGNLHTVKITTATTAEVRLVGVSGANASGVVVHNHGIYGAVADVWNGASYSANIDYLVAPNYLASDGTDLVIFQFGINESTGTSTHTVGTTSGSATITDVSVDSSHYGCPISGTGIPANAFIGRPLIENTSFQMVSASGYPLTATATGASVTITLGTPASATHLSQAFRRLMQFLKDGTGQLGGVDVLIVMGHVGKFDNANLSAPSLIYQDYCATMRGVAEQYGAAFLDLWTLGKNSWNYYNSLGLWGNAATPNVSGGDNVHLSDAGHLLKAQAIASILTA